MVLPMLMLLTGGGQPLPTVTVDGQRVPAAQVRVVGGRTLVACGWLEKTSAAFRCSDARPYHQQRAEVQAIGRPTDTVRNVVFTPSSTTRQTYRNGLFRDPMPLNERAVFEQEVFIPLRSLATAFDAPLTEQNGQIRLGRPAAFARLTRSIEQGSLFEARQAAQVLKVRREVPVLQPSGQATETNDRLTLWPQGEVRRQFEWSDDVLTYAEIREGWLVTRWTGKLAGKFMHDQRKDPPHTGRTGQDTLSRYLGQPFAAQHGQRPLVQGPLSFEAGHIFGIATTQYWGQITPDGREIMQQDAYYQYGDRLVRGADGVLTRATEPLPDPYAGETRLDATP